MLGLYKNISMQLSTLKQALGAFEKNQKHIPDLQHIFGQVRRGAKHSISLTRRDNVTDAAVLLKECELLIKKGIAKAGKDVELAAQGFYREAIEEYVEGRLYWSFVADKKIVFPSYVSLTFWDMLGGWSDFTGELVRRAISLAHEAEIKEIERLKTVTEKVVEMFSQVSFSGKLRNKYDATERNLKRLEEILYELKLRG